MKSMHLETFWRERDRLNKSYIPWQERKSARMFLILDSAKQAIKMLLSR